MHCNCIFFNSISINLFVQNEVLGETNLEFEVLLPVLGRWTAVAAGSVLAAGHAPPPPPPSAKAVVRVLGAADLAGFLKEILQLNVFFQFLYGESTMLKFSKLEEKN